MYFVYWSSIVRLDHRDKISWLSTLLLIFVKVLHPSWAQIRNFYFQRKCTSEENDCFVHEALNKNHRNVSKTELVSLNCSQNSWISFTNHIYLDYEILII